MQKFLKIENPGVCPPEGFTLFGATAKRTCKNPLTIGTFGSGNKHSTCLLLRCGIKPTVFCSYLKMSFFTKPVSIKGVNGTLQAQQVCVQYNGMTEAGKTCTREEKLSVTLGYGVSDWNKIQLALREYVSNALDACFEVGMNVIQTRNSIKVEIVGETQVRAKNGYTGIFVPLTPEVEDFYKNLSKWFLHFSEPKLVTQAILPKANRNMSSEKKVPVIYRRGVFVREFLSTSKTSLYDYNLSDLRLDEARIASDWDVKQACGQAIVGAEQPILNRVLGEVINNSDVWEASLDESALSSDYVPVQEKERRKHNLVTAFTTLAGPNGVVMGSRHDNLVDMVRRKGFTPIAIQSISWLENMRALGIKTDDQVLTQDDRDGTTYSDATADVKAISNWVWNLVQEFDMTCGKDKPPVGCFFRRMEAGETTMGLYKDGKVLVHSDLSEGQNELLKVVVMHEVGHHCTGATDGSYDFNVWFNRFCVRMGTKMEEFATFHR